MILRFLDPRAACILTILAGLVACASPRVHRLTDFEYLPKAPDAPIDLYINKLTPPFETRPYEAIAIVDSERYPRKDKATTQIMLEDLRRQVRRLGGDAGHGVKRLSVKIQGAVPDERVPVPAAWKQGYYRLYFLRAEVVKFVQEIGLPPAKYHLPPADRMVEEKEKRALKEPTLVDDATAIHIPEAALEEEKRQRPTRRFLREPSLAEEEEPAEEPIRD